LILNHFQKLRYCTASQKSAQNRSNRGKTVTKPHQFTFSVSKFDWPSFRFPVRLRRASLFIYWWTPVLVDTGSATVDKVVENRHLQEPSLNGRDALALSMFTPGVRNSAGPLITVLPIAAFASPP
jgi:hypothetical protein